MPKPSLSPFLLDLNAEPEALKPAANHNTPPCAGTGPALDGAELFVVAALRGWCAPMMRPGESHPDWRDLFRLADIDAVGMLGFDALMTVIGAQAQRLIEVNCCQCSDLCEDEMLMLRLVTALQAGDMVAALEVLAEWLPEDAAIPALQAARCFVRAMTDAGLLLPHGDSPGAFPTGVTRH